MKIIKFVYIITILILINSIAHSESFIEIKDTTLLRNGKISKLPVYSNIDLSNINNLIISFELNSLLLDIKGIEGGSDFGINEISPTFEIDNSTFTKTKLTIYGKQLNSNYTGKLCNIILETLAGPDSIANLNPVGLSINGNPDTNINLKPGKIFIGTPLYEKITEGIGEIFPNPFTNDATISFIVKEDTKINFKIYSMSGRLVTSIPGEKAIEYQFYDTSGEKIDDITDHIFTRGLYKMKFNAVDWLFSAGNYYIVMQTKLGTYHSNFIHIK